MKVIIGGKLTGKTTVLLHYVYNEIEKLVNAHSQNQQTSTKVKMEGQQHQQEQVPHVCVLTSQRRMKEAQMLFGIYCEV